MVSFLSQIQVAKPLDVKTKFFNIEVCTECDKSISKVFFYMCRGIYVCQVAKFYSQPELEQCGTCSQNTCSYSLFCLLRVVSRYTL